MLSRILVSPRKPIWTLAIMLFFLMLFDGTLGYIVPLLISNSVDNNSALGVIIGSSSLIGGIFDFLLTRFIKNTHFRRIFIGMFIFCFLYLAMLMIGGTLIFFLLAMACWGMWFDLMIFGTFNFIGRELPESEHASGFAMVDILRSLALVIAPLITGWLVADIVDVKPFIAAIIFLGISIICYFILILSYPKKLAIQKETKIRHVYSFIFEIKEWRKIGKKISPVLIFFIMINILDSFFWTLGPLVSEDLSEIIPFGGLFLTAYFLPVFLVGWFVGPITKRFGKKKTAFVSLILGSIVMTFFALTRSPILMILITFISSLLAAISWPSMKGATADYISEAPIVEKEIEGVSDFASNVGYIIGPILAGVLSDNFGNNYAFSLLGILGLMVGIILFVVTPKHIKLPNHF